jgi:hypothetical protein
MKQERIGCSEGVVQSRRCAKQEDHQRIFLILRTSPNTHRIRVHPKNARSRSEAHMMGADKQRRVVRLAGRLVGDS